MVRRARRHGPAEKVPLIGPSPAEGGLYRSLGGSAQPRERKTPSPASSLEGSHTLLCARNTKRRDFGLGKTQVEGCQLARPLPRQLNVAAADTGNSNPKREIRNKFEYPKFNMFPGELPPGELPPGELPPGELPPGELPRVLARLLRP